MRYKCVTVAANTRAEILFVTERHGRRYKEIIGTFARWRPTGRISALGLGEIETVYDYGPHGNGPVEGELIALTGRYVAAAESANCNSPTSCSASGKKVVRVDIKSGQRVRTSEGLEEVTDLVLTPKGTVAWIEKVCNFGPGDERHCEGHSLRMARTPSQFSNPTLLASSPAIDPHSLATTGGHLYWTEAGQPRQAQIE